MKERMTAEVSPGDVLQVRSSSGPIGKSVTVPEGTTSITIVFRDTKGVQAKFDRKNKTGGRRKASPVEPSQGGQSDKSESGFIAAESEAHDRKPKVPSSR
jgi:hypothetical protein